MCVTHCSTLQHTATHCNTLQHTATHCNTLQHTALPRTHCNMQIGTERDCSQFPTTHCDILQHTAPHCNTLQHTVTHCNTLQHNATRQTQRIMYVPLLANVFQKSVLVIVQYKYFNSRSKELILLDLILRTRPCSTAFITQHSWLLHFHPTEICRVESMYTSGVPVPKRHLGGASPYIFLHNS